VKSDFSLISSLTSGQQNFVLSDPRLLDNPIVYASEGFYQLTGYKREEVLGRNCRFLQGPGTDPKAIDVIRAAVANGTDATTCLLNYKADGTPFWNQFFVAALRDSDNCIVNYVGVQCAIDSNAGASALEDKVNSVLPLQNRGESPTQESNN
jgi:PAS domain S-box-containing protein